MSDTIKHIENKIIPKYFGLFLFIIGTNLIGLTVLNKNLEIVRYLRQPSLGIALVWLFYAFPVNAERRRFQGLTRFFIFLIVFLAFNILNSIDKANSAQYSLWLITSFAVLHQFLFVRNHLKFSQLFYQFALAVWILGIVAIIVSLAGAYVFGIELFFDERYNYSQMQITIEFSGIFGSNNSMGFITFITLVFSLFLFQLQKGTGFSWFNLVLAVALIPLIVFIGNRASMACAGVFWVLFLTYINRSIPGLLLLFMGFFLGSLSYQDTILQKLRLEQFEGGNIFGNRSDLIREALFVAREMDFFGVGYHNQRVARKYFGVVGENEKEFNFHNTYLAVYTELGPLGLFWIPGFILVILLWPVTKNIPERNRKLLRMLRVFSGIMVLMYLPVEDSVNSPGSPSFLFFWIGLALLLIGSYPDVPPSKLYEKKSSFSD